MYVDTTRWDFDFVSGFSQYNWPILVFYASIKSTAWSSVFVAGFWCTLCSLVGWDCVTVRNVQVLPCNDWAQQIQTDRIKHSWIYFERFKLQYSDSLFKPSFLRPLLAKTGQGHREPWLWETLLRKRGVWGGQFTNKFHQVPTLPTTCSVRPRRSWCLCRHLWLLRWGRNQNQIRSQLLVWSDGLQRSLAIGYRCR